VLGAAPGAGRAPAIVVESHSSARSVFAVRWFGPHTPNGVIVSTASDAGSAPANT